MGENSSLSRFYYTVCDGTKIKRVNYTPHGTDQLENLLIYISHYEELIHRNRTIVAGYSRIGGEFAQPLPDSEKGFVKDTLLKLGFEGRIEFW
jgi:hypothetical protein